MDADHQRYLWPMRDFFSESCYLNDVDHLIESIAVRDLLSKRLHRSHLLASDVFRRSTIYKPVRSWPTTNRYRYCHVNRSFSTRPVLPRPITPVVLPPITFDHYQPSFHLRNYHRYDFSSLNLYNREPSFFPLAQNYYRLQTNYEQFHTRKAHSWKHVNCKQRWRVAGFILIFYFLLKKNLRLAKEKETYYQRDYRRIRFLELLTAVHRVYLEPKSAIHNALSYVINQADHIIDQENFFLCTRTILNQIGNFLPEDGILGASNDESVLIYILNCSLEQYPSTYFWAIERHLLSLSYSKMKEHGHAQLDHFTTKFLLISTFIFHCLIKTLLLKPVKYRLTRGQLGRKQWLNTRLLSTLILYVARHAVIYKEENGRLPMPFPFEMKNYLIEDNILKETFLNLEQLVESTAPKLSSWACEYAERLQRHLRTKRIRS